MQVYKSGNNIYLKRSMQFWLDTSFSYSDFIETKIDLSNPYIAQVFKEDIPLLASNNPKYWWPILTYLDKDFIYVFTIKDGKESDREELRINNKLDLKENEITNDQDTCMYFLRIAIMQWKFSVNTEKDNSLHDRLADMLEYYDYDEKTDSRIDYDEILESKVVQRPTKIIQYLLLLKHIHKQSVFAVFSAWFKEPILVDEGNIARFVGWGSFIVNISNLLYVSHTWKFEDHIDQLTKKYGQSKETYDQLIEDIKNIPYLWEEFRRAKITLQLKHGKPHVMETETKTNNTDYYYWKEVLWDHREINEKTRSGKTEVFEVKKKFKY